MTCLECLSLQEEVRQLRRELAYEIDASEADRLQVGLGLTKQQAALVSALYRAKGRHLSNSALSELIPRIDGAERDNGYNMVNVQISKIRARLDRAFIQNVWGRGFMLSEAGRAKCESIISAIAQGGDA